MRCRIAVAFRSNLPISHTAVAAFSANTAAATTGIATLSADPARLRGMYAAAAGGLPAASADHATSRRPGWRKKRQLHRLQRQHRTSEPQRCHFRWHHRGYRARQAPKKAATPECGAGFTVDATDGAPEHAVHIPRGGV
jgi:hypothetical protein